MSTKTGAGGKPQEYDERTGRYGDGSDADLLAEREFKQEQLARKAEGRVPLKRDIYESLSKSEWAEYYKKLGEMKSGTLQTRTFGNGTRFIVVNKKVILDNGKYVSPKVRAVIEFSDENELYDYLNKWEVNYDRSTRSKK